MVEQHNEVTEVQKRISSRAMLSALFLGAVFFLLHEKAVAKGLVLGTCFSVLNFYLLGKFIPMALGQTRRMASFIGFGSLLFRYVLLAFPLVVAIKSTSFSFVAAAIGIFAVQIVTLADYVVIKPFLARK